MYLQLFWSLILTIWTVDRNRVLVHVDVCVIDRPPTSSQLHRPGYSYQFYIDELQGLWVFVSIQN